MRTLDIGIASYNNAHAIGNTIDKLIQHTTQTDWRLLVVDNASPDPVVRTILEQAEKHPRITVRYRDTNIGYAGAVNEILEWGESQYVAYCDNDATVLTPGWDGEMVRVLDNCHEVAMIFPEGGSYPIPRTQYWEILWGVGCFWMVKKARATELGGFDTTLGHQEEVDFQTRLRLEGWRIASTHNVQVRHEAVSSRNPEAQERINQGIINWVNKWVAYFGGKHLNYFSPNVIRFEDWPVNALYLEEYFLERGMGNMNMNPETIMIDGAEKDLIKVPRWKDLYRGRII